ncbi:MAG: chemotaxis protein CheW [Armatimonadetes bacterium]|nr:chemotaxis protein CheW [Armatimonadota bacterium]
MLVLVFHLGAERYGFEAARVLEVLPRLPCRLLLGVPECVAGIFDYRGVLTPMVDLCSMFLGRPAADRLSTRLIVVEVPSGRGTDRRALGLVAERITETISADLARLQPSRVRSDFSCMGELIPHPDGPIQLVRPDELLSPELRDRLYFEEAGA